MIWKIPAGAALLLTLVLGATSASAHSKKVATLPANGAVLTASPDRIVMDFDVPVRMTLVSLTDQNGTEHVLKRNDEMRPVSQFSAGTTALPAGKYKVEWRGLAADGHPMQGSTRWKNRVYCLAF
ncbi:MAG: copper resistance protein CopC [Burkholderiaceae bacterium]